MCVMMTEIQNIEGGQKKCLLTRGDQKFKKNIFKQDLFAKGFTDCGTGTIYLGTLGETFCRKSLEAPQVKQAWFANLV